MNDGLIKKMPMDALNDDIGETLKSHNTYTMTTGSRYPSAMSVEYIYLEVKIYILSKG